MTKKRFGHWGRYLFIFLTLAAAVGLCATTATAAKKPVTKVVGGNVFEDANYTGPFPAPEGIELRGAYYKKGSVLVKQPTGKGPFKFAIELGKKKYVSCLDNTRKITSLYSKGTNWENGFNYAYNIGRTDSEEVDPQYNDAPKGDGAGNEWYDEGYRAGYGFGWKNMPVVLEDCKDVKYKVGDFDTDGWFKNTFSDIKGLVAYMPPAKYARLNKNYDKSALGTGTHSWLFDQVVEETMIEKTDLNKKNGKLNISRIDIGELDLDADAATKNVQNAEEFAKLFYDTVIASMPASLKRNCPTVDGPSIKTTTYGKNKVTTLTYVLMCRESFGDKIKGEDLDGTKWNLHTYAFIQKPSDPRQLLLFYVENGVNDIKKYNEDAVDKNKVYNGNFMKQMMGKIQYK